MISSILFGAFGLLLVIGAPITVALGMAAMAAFMSIGKDVTTLVQIAYNSVNSFPVMALPAFILSGALMQGSGISRRLVEIAEVLAGRMSGGLASSTVLFLDIDSFRIISMSPRQAGRTDNDLNRPPALTILI